VIKRLRVYLDTSVVISLTDSLDMFHDESVTFIAELSKQKVQCKISSPLMLEIGKIYELKGIQRCLDIMSSFKEFKIDFEGTDMEEVYKLSQAYLNERILTIRHRLDLFHYAAASLLNCAHLASWNSRQFNHKIAAKVNTNSKQGLLILIAGRPDHIIRQENLG
jgi:predicted nucleic acid-binding protein